MLTLQDELTFEDHIHRARANVTSIIENGISNKLKATTALRAGSAADAMKNMPSECRPASREFSSDVNKELKEQGDDVVSESKKMKEDKVTSSEFMQRMAERKEKMKKSMNSKVDEYFDKLTEVGKKLTPKEQDVMLSGLDVIQDFIGGIINKVLDTVMEFASKILNAVVDAFNWLKDKLGSYAHSVTNFFMGAFLATPVFLQHVSDVFGEYEAMMIVSKK